MRPAQNQRRLTAAAHLILRQQNAANIYERHMDDAARLFSKELDAARNFIPAMKQANLSAALMPESMPEKDVTASL